MTKKVLFVTMLSFGEEIRRLRKSNNLRLREVAAALEIDQSLLSKIETGDRNATRNQVISMATFFKVDPKIFLSLWLAEKIANSVKYEDVAYEAICLAKESIREYKTIISNNS